MSDACRVPQNTEATETERADKFFTNLCWLLLKRDEARPADRLNS